jgi:hypothetical protein
MIEPSLPAKVMMKNPPTIFSITSYPYQNNDSVSHTFFMKVLPGYYLFYVSTGKTSLALGFHGMYKWLFGMISDKYSWHYHCLIIIHPERHSS